MNNLIGVDVDMVDIRTINNSNFYVKHKTNNHHLLENVTKTLNS